MSDSEDILNSTMARALAFLDAGDAAGALSIVDELVGRDWPDGVRGEALAYRAMIRERLGQLAEAISDLLAARQLQAPHGYRRYATEQTLGRLAEQRGDRDEALRWCRIALDTVVKDPSTSGAGSVRRLIELVGDVSGLTPEDRRLAERVLENGWRLFGLPGSPNLNRLGESAEAILAHHGRPLDANPRGAKDD